MCLVPLTDHCDKHCVDSHIVEELHRRSADLAAQIQKISWSLFTIKDEIDYPNVTAYCSCSEESKRSGWLVRFACFSARIDAKVRLLY